MNPLTNVPLTEEIRLTKYLDLQINLVFRALLWVTGTLVTPVKTCMKFLGTPAKTCRKVTEIFLFWSDFLSPWVVGNLGEWSWLYGEQWFVTTNSKFPKWWGLVYKIILRAILISLSIIGVGGNSGNKHHYTAIRDSPCAVAMTRRLRKCWGALDLC